jgi:hypothetical protein
MVRAILFSEGREEDDVMKMISNGLKDIISEVRENVNKGKRRKCNNK